MSKSIQLLLVDDETTLGFIVKESLESRGFEVRYCEDGEAGWNAFQEDRPDVCILDVMMPKRDGFYLATAIREADPHVPLIFLTAKSQTKDVVKGFELGGNDYVKKPFSMEELIVRVQSLLRDRQQLSDQSLPAQPIWEIGLFRFDVQRQALKGVGKARKLTHRETEILDRLCRNRNQVMERKAVLLELWGDDNFFNARSMDVFITKLRKYLKPDPQVEIVNVRGVGYKLIC